MPYIAHKRLVTVVHSPVHNVYYSGSMLPIRIHARVRPSVIMAELKRIRDLPRPTTKSYTDDYLNSWDHIYFDDEAKEIRARVDSLLRRVHVYIPRASPSDFAEEIVPERMRSGDYVRRLISGRNNMKKDADAVSWYDVPERGNFGNLACVKYVAGKPQSIRRPYYKVADLRPSDIKNDVNFLSYYQKNRQAAANASPDHPMTERELRKARALETEWSESIAKREARPAPEEKEEIELLPEEEIKPRAKPVEESKQDVESPPEEEVKAKAKPVKESKPDVELPVEEEIKPKAKPGKESKLKKSKEADAAKKTESKVESPKETVIPVVKEAPKEPEIVAEPVKEEKIVETPEEVAEPPKTVEIVEEPPKKVEIVEEHQEVEVPAQQVETQPEAKVEEETTVEPTVEPATTEVAVVDSTEPVEEVKQEVVEEVEAKPVEEPVIEAAPASTEVVSEKDQQEEETEEVKQDKADAARRAEEYLRKVADEARTEEEKRKAAEDERTRMEVEEKKLWEAAQIDMERKIHIDEIIEQEKALAERKAEEERLEAERTELMRLEEAERQLNDAKLRALLEEQERMLIEERAEDVRRRQEQEERLAEVNKLGEPGAIKDRDCSHEDHLFTEVTDQQLEEKPYEVDTDEDTRIEEETVVDDEVEEIPADPFVEEPEGAESRPVATGGTAIDDVTSATIEESFEWPDED